MQEIFCCRRVVCKKWHDADNILTCLCIAEGLSGPRVRKMKLISSLLCGLYIESIWFDLDGKNLSGCN